MCMTQAKERQPACTPEVEVEMEARITSNYLLFIAIDEQILRLRLRLPQ